MKTISLSLFYLLLISTQLTYSQEFDAAEKNVPMKRTKSANWHIEEIKGRYWFITPEGNPLFILGVNHLEASSKEEQEKAIHHLTDWGFNTAGYGVPKWALDRLPGFISITLHDAAHWLPAHRFGYEDVFSSAFEEKVKEIIRQKCEAARDQANVIGYSFTDTPRYQLDIVRKRRGTDWVSYLRSLAADAAGKQTYVQFLREEYSNDITAFQQKYRLPHISSFNELLDFDFQHLELTRPAIRQDDEAFLVRIVERIYQLSQQYIREFHPGALMVSEKYKSYDHTDGILKAAGKYFDVIAIQAGPTQGPDVGQGPDESIFDPSYWKKLHELTEKPLFVVDHGFSFYTEAYPRTLWHQFPSEKAAAQFYDSYLKQVIQEPYIVGYMKCQYKNRYDPIRTLLKQGLIDEEGNPYAILVNQIRETNESVLKTLYAN